MTACPDGRAALTGSARLLIHTGYAMGANKLMLAPALRRMRLSYSFPKNSAPIQVIVEDLAGNRVLSLDDAAPLIDLPLPPGTYQVTACHENVRRGYTLTLGRDTSFDLYLSFADASE